MNTTEICRNLGPNKWKHMMSELPSGLLKKLLVECKVSTSRSFSRLSTAARNEDWIQRLWLHVEKPSVATVVLYTWLGACRQAMLSTFLDELGVKHTQGFTEEDFWKHVSDETLLQATASLLEDPRWDRAEAAAYLLFLDNSNQSTRMQELQLAQHLPAWKSPSPANTLS